jgi:hypothetical protein
LRKCKKAQKSAQGLEKKGDSSSKGANLKPGKDSAAGRYTPAFFGKSAQLVVGNGVAKRTLSEEGKREQKTADGEREGDGGPRGVVANHSQLIVPQHIIFVK